MNKKGVGPIGAIALFGMFLIVWFVGLSKFLSEVGQDAIDAGNVTGLEAWFCANLNFIVFVIVILAMIGWMYFGASQ